MSQLIALPGIPPFSKTELLATGCRRKFSRFVKEFWDEVPSAEPMQWNWHMTALCEEIESCSRRVFNYEPIQYNSIFNLVFGSSKSTICTVLFMPWTWTRMPRARHGIGTHTESLGHDLATKCLAVIESDKFHDYFPEIELVSKNVSDFKNNYGGERLVCTVGGKTPRGRHFHFLSCLPYESRIITERGILQIGKIVEDKLDIRVLGFDHNRNEFSWQSVEKFECNSASMLDRIQFSDGSFLEVTEDHPIYVVGKGYIPVSEMREGDEVIHAKALPSLWEDGGALPRTFCTSQNGESVLLSRSRGGIFNGSKSYSVQKVQKELQDLWEGDFGISMSRRYESLLRLQMQGISGKRGRQSFLHSEGRNALWQLWEDSQGISATFGTRQLLQSGLCQQRTCKKDAGGGQCELSTWKCGQQISESNFEESSINSDTRKEMLFALRDESEREWREIERPPYRLRQESQSEKKFSSSLSKLSFAASRINPQSIKVGTKIVSSIARKVRLSAATYNLRISETHNYVAEGILVHNCDDPLDPKKAASELERKSAAEFVTEELPSRRVNKQVSWMFLVMQRLGQGDPSEVMWKMGLREGAIPVKRFVFPGELTDDVEPKEFRKYYKDGLFDPVRLPRFVLNQYKSIGAMFYAAQVLQNPRKSEGGRFKPQWFNQRCKAAPYRAKRVRSWDRACFVAGTMVETINGPKAIETIQVDEKVLTRKGWKRVLKSGFTKYAKELISVRFGNGQILTGTPDHQIWTENRGWVDLSSIVSSDYNVCILSGEQTCRNEIQNLSESYLMGSNTRDGKERDIFLLGGFEKTVRVGRIRCIGQFGDFITEKFQKEMTFTIKMGTGIIMRSETSNVFRGENIINDTIVLQNGIANPKRMQYEKQMCKKDGREHSIKFTNVKCATKNLNRDTWIPRDSNSVLWYAEVGTDTGSQKYVKSAPWSFGVGRDQLHVRNNALLNFGQENVQFVERNLKRKQEFNYAVIGVAELFSFKETAVYDLTIEDCPEFFANGILVHNSTDAAGCNSAGVLMAFDGSDYFVEHVECGQWEPVERNQRILAAAIRDRARYGPEHEPFIEIEEEGGSTAADARKSLATVLAGFRFAFVKPTGSKDVRAEPWSCQLAAGNVWLVDNGEKDGTGRADWDINAYVEEHVLFQPDVSVKRLGGMKDRVDASSAAFSHLSGGRAPMHIKVIKFNGTKRGQIRIVVCTEEEMGRLIIEDPAVIISCRNPIIGNRLTLVSQETKGMVGYDLQNGQVNGNGGDQLRDLSCGVGTEGNSGDDPPLHSCSKLLGRTELRFADVQPQEEQDRWGELVQPYGVPAAELILTPSEAKKAWQLLVRKFDPPYQIIVVSDSGKDNDRRALSVAAAICDTLRLPKELTLCKPEQPEWKFEKGMEVGNRHAWLCVKAARNMVIG